MRKRKISKELRVQVLVRDKYRCKMCGRSKDEVSLHVDHIIPVAKGGTDEIDNLAALCSDCNIGKSDYLFTDYSNISLIPEDIEKFFKFYHDERIGRFEQYHWYCFFRQPGGSLSSQGEFHHSWKITDTEFALSSNRSAFEERRKQEEMVKFKEIIRKELAKQRKRMIVTEEGLELI
ncbi:MAG: HNH endonuclease signature motif containing protein [Acidobacteriota bacterium]